jgi:hypothetical protein
VLDVTTWPTDRSPAEVFNPGRRSQPSVTPLITAPSNPTTVAVAQTTVAVPPKPITTAPSEGMPNGHSNQQAWHLKHRQNHPVLSEIRRLHPKAHLRGVSDVELGEWNGKPVAKFEIAASPPAVSADAAAKALRRGAHALLNSGLQGLPPELVGGPLAALMRGGAVELHFQNGVVIRTAL